MATYLSRLDKAFPNNPQLEAQDGERLQRILEGENVRFKLTEADQIKVLIMVSKRNAQRSGHRFEKVTPPTSMTALSTQTQIIQHLGLGSKTMMGIWNHTPAHPMPEIRGGYPTAMGIWNHTPAHPVPEIRGGYPTAPPPPFVPYLRLPEAGLEGVGVGAGYAPANIGPEFRGVNGRGHAGHAEPAGAGPSLRDMTAITRQDTAQTQSTTRQTAIETAQKANEQRDLENALEKRDAAKKAAKEVDIVAAQTQHAVDQAIQRFMNP